MRAAGRFAAGDSKAVNLSDHGASRDAAELSGDLAGGQTLLPQSGERFDPLVAPIHSATPG
jgi:hypothetical protein